MRSEREWRGVGRSGESGVSRIHRERERERWREREIDR